MGNGKRGYPFFIFAIICGFKGFLLVFLPILTPKTAFLPAF